MTDYTKLVKELRGCKYIDYCKDCPRMAANGYVEICNIKDDAAAAIEELQARLGEAENSVERWKDMYLSKHEPKRGKWMNVTDSYFWYGRCSVCGAELNVDGWYAELMNYCPNCGAKMEVQDETKI